MEFINYILAFLIFLATPYLVLLTLAMIWWVARKVKQSVVAVLKYIESPIK